MTYKQVTNGKDTCGQAPTMYCLLGLARDEAKTIEDPRQRSSELSSIAETQAEAGYIEAAFATVRMIEDTECRSMALSRIAQLLLENI